MSRTLALAAVVFCALTLVLACGRGDRDDERGDGSGASSGAEDPTPSTPEATTGQACGGMAGVACGDGDFCDYPASAMCGAADGQGVCTPIPTACTREMRPVCGCDDQTYPNACNARAAGVSVRAAGTCAMGSGGSGQAITEPGAGRCVRMGCNGELCHDAGDPHDSACVVRPEHACYRDADCTRLPSGECGFEQTAELAECLANPPVAR